MVFVNDGYTNVTDKTQADKKVEYLDTQFVQTAFAENILLCPSAAEQFPIIQKNAVPKRNSVISFIIFMKQIPTGQVLKNPYEFQSEDEFP